MNTPRRFRRMAVARLVMDILSTRIAAQTTNKRIVGSARLALIQTPPLLDDPAQASPVEHRAPEQLHSPRHVSRRRVAFLGNVHSHDLRSQYCRDHTSRQPQSLSETQSLVKRRVRCYRPRGGRKSSTRDAEGRRKETADETA